ncbi:MAG: plasmid recombination protein [Blautia sp.]|jgi:hypothetical protein
MPDYSVARVMQRTQESVCKFERHIERKNDNYENMNVDLSRTDMNIHFKDCRDLTYNQQLEKMVAEGTVSLRGLKANAKVFDEMIFDVNTDYFECNGGYEFAKRFYEEAYHFAEKLYGKDNILSAVMHADEVNLFISDVYSYPVYHYHLHIMTLSVVDKEIKWSKHCKNPELVGTVKEVIYQVSHSKKWKSAKALDENGKPLTTNPPFGYMKSPENKNVWIIDESAAKVVKKIFDLCISGLGPTQIAKRLKADEIMTPTEYWNSIGRKWSKPSERPFNRCADTVSSILDKQEYCGDTVNFRTTSKSFKLKKRFERPQEE